MIDKTTKTLIGAAIVIVVVVAIILVAAFSHDSVNINENKIQDTQEKEVVKFGLIVPLTVAAADIGKSNKNSFEIAVNEINAAGGINGVPIELIIEDSKGCDSKEAVSAMQKLVNIDKVDAVYSICSGAAIATHPIAEQGGVVHFGCASNPAVRELGDYMFRIVPSDDFAGKVAAEYVRSEFGAQKVAVLNCDNDWCVGIKNAFVDSFRNLGGEILIQEQIKTSATDVRTELTKIKDTNPDLVYFAGYPDETITVFKQAEELGLDVVFFGGDAWLDQTIPEKAGDTAEDKYFTTPAAGYSKAFENKVGGDIAICTVEAYDVAKILAKVMSDVGFDKEEVKNALYSLKNYDGESGVIGLDSKGDLIGAKFDIKTFSGGQIVSYDSGIQLEEN